MQDSNEPKIPRQNQAKAQQAQQKAQHSSEGEVAQGFVKALAMIERLPLTDAEKVEAVRRLLATQAPQTP